MAERQVDRSVSGHYAPTDVDAALRSVLDGLRAAGKDPDALTPDDLAPVDQFHSRGKAATDELARLAGLRGGEQVLDVGAEWAARRGPWRPSTAAA